MDELAAATSISSRTIRFYQAEGLLPKPARDPSDGRVARYLPAHVELLKLIGQLRDRGLRLPAIRDLLSDSNAETVVADWLGLDASLRGPWVASSTRIVDRDELDELLRECPPGTIALFQEEGLISRRGEQWIVTNVELAQLCANLIRNKIEPELVFEAGRILRLHLSKAADQLMDLFATAFTAGFGEGTAPNSLIDALRPVAGDAARYIFASELERSSSTLLNDTKRLGKRG